MQGWGLGLGPGVHLRALGRLGSWVLHGDLGIGMSLRVGMCACLCGRDKWVFVGMCAFVCLSVFLCMCTSVCLYMYLCICM